MMKPKTLSNEIAVLGSVHSEMVNFGSWPRRTTRDIIPLDEISHLIVEYSGVQQTATDGRPAARDFPSG
jgi:hypothetical protein